MKNFLFGPGAESTCPSLGILVLRLAVGGLMLIQHGWSKLADFAEKKESFPDPIGLGSEISLGLAVFAEVGCSVLLIFGLLTRLASIPLLITMAVAVFLVHAADPLSAKELPILYLVTYLTLLIAGPGRYSADALIHR
jgi:putative oxidoreductase